MLDRLETIDWARDSLKRKGYKLLSEPKIVRSMPWSTVIFFQTSGRSVYLKCMLKDFAYEPAVIDFFNKHNFQNVPSIIAIDKIEGSFLMQDAGEPLRPILQERYDVSMSCLVLETYAKLQINCIPLVDSLIQIGIRDCRLACLPDLYRQFILNKDLLLSDGLTDQDIARLQTLSETFTHMCVQLATCGIPETVEHGDFHDNNVLINEDQITIHDCGDAAITHPIFSISSFLNSTERHHYLNPLAKECRVMRDCYLDQWGDYASKDLLATAFRVAYRLRPFLFALSFARIKTCPEIDSFPEYNGYLAESMRTLISNMVE